MFPSPQVFLTSKVSPYQQGSAAAAAALDATLAQLGTTYVVGGWLPGCQGASSPLMLQLLRYQLWVGLSS